MKTPLKPKLSVEQLEGRTLPSATPLSNPLIETAQVKHMSQDSHEAIAIVMDQNEHEGADVSGEHLPVHQDSVEQHLSPHAVDQAFIGTEQAEHEEESEEEAEAYKEAQEIKAKHHELEEAGNEATELQDEHIKEEGKEKEEEAEGEREEEEKEEEKSESEEEGEEFESEEEHEEETLFENPDKEVAEKLHDPFIDFKPEKLLSEKELWKVHTHHPHTDHEMLHALAHHAKHEDHASTHDHGTDLRGKLPHGAGTHGTKDTHGQPTDGMNAHGHDAEGKHGEKKEEGKSNSHENPKHDNHHKEPTSGTPEHGDSKKEHENEQAEHAQEQNHAAAALARAGLLPALAANEISRESPKKSALSVTEISGFAETKKPSFWQKTGATLRRLFGRK